MNDYLFDDYIGLVRKIVNKMDYGYIDKDDLFQAGLIGLYKASLKYDESINKNYISFSSVYIVNEIKNELRNNKLIKLNKKIIKIKKYLKNNENLTFAQVAKNLNETHETVYLSSVYGNDIKRLDDMNNEIEDSTHNIYHKDILTQISLLEKKEKEVLILRYYKNYSQSEVAKILKCSQSKISRIEKSALNIIKNKML